MTRLKDAIVAMDLGAEKLGFIIHENSPRKIDLVEVNKFKTELSLDSEQMVAVEVSPTIEDVKKMLDQGFGNFQFHFEYDLPKKLIENWARLVGPKNLWLAPRIPTGIDFPVDLLSLADNFLVDAYSDDKYGGTGKCSDWENFSKWRNLFPSNNWILAGGLSPENIKQAIGQTDALIVDVNSGVEQSPGIKDHDKLRQFFTKIS